MLSIEKDLANHDIEIAQSKQLSCFKYSFKQNPPNLSQM